jgi:hypothetical protein
VLEFGAILATLVETHAPALSAAIFCDEEGERVDSFALDGVDKYDLELMGAALANVARTIPAGIAVRVLFDGRAVWMTTVESGYYLIAFAQRSRDGAVKFDLPRAVAALAAHM